MIWSQAPHAHPLMVRRREAPSRTMSWRGSERAAILRDARKSALLRMRGGVNAQLAANFERGIAHTPSLMVRRRGAPSRTMSWRGSELAAIPRDARKSALLRMRGGVNAQLAANFERGIAHTQSLMVRRRGAPSRTMSCRRSERYAACCAGRITLRSSALRFSVIIANSPRDEAIQFFLHAAFRIAFHPSTLRCYTASKSRLTCLLLDASL